MSSDDIKIVRRMCEHGNGLFHDACLSICDEIERLRTAGDALVKAIRSHDLHESHVKAWQEARRGQ